jgi:hypothetical protein
MIPIQESYEMQRKMNRPKKVDVVAQNKMGKKLILLKFMINGLFFEY